MNVWLTLPIWQISDNSCFLQPQFLDKENKVANVSCQIDYIPYRFASVQHKTTKTSKQIVQFCLCFLSLRIVNNQHHNVAASKLKLKGQYCCLFYRCSSLSRNNLNKPVIHGSHLCLLLWSDSMTEFIVTLHNVRSRKTRIAEKQHFYLHCIQRMTICI